jgi:predicted nucleotidyltransferase
MLVVGNALTSNDKELVTKSLMYFAEELSPDLDIKQLILLNECLRNDIIFEDVVAKKDVHNLRDHADRFGYLLVLGTEAGRKLEHTSASVDVVECHTLVPKEWGDARLRDRVIEQLKGLVKAWIEMETESRVVEVAKTDTHEVEWVQQNSDQFKRHIQLMIQNGRPHVILFSNIDAKNHVILRDATKRLREPMQEIVPIVADEKVLGAPEKSLKKFEQLGYSKVFLMDIDEFMSHIMSMCAQMNGEPARIIVEPVK